MNRRTLLISIVLIDFLVLTVYAVAEVGYVNLIAQQFNNWGGIQVLVDLVIVCALAVLWMILDARERGGNPWPFVIITLFAGSFGPLLYLLQREWRRGADATRAVSQT